MGPEAINGKLIQIITYEMGSVDVSDGTFAESFGYFDWRNFVPRTLIDIWQTLSRNERMIAAIVAHRAAKKAEWNS